MRGADLIEILSLTIFLVTVYGIPSIILPLIISRGLTPSLVPENGYMGLLMELAYIFALILGFSSIVFILARYRQFPALVALFLASISILFLTVPFTLFSLLIDEIKAYMIALGLFIAWIISIRIRLHQISRILISTLILAVGTLSGILLSILMPLYLSICFLIIMIIYDFLSVRYGALRELMRNVLGPEVQVVGKGSIVPKVLMYVTAYIGLLNVGIGDVVAYSLLISISYVLLEHWIYVLGIFISMLIGLLLTLTAMRKKRLRYAPGLPLPLSLGLMTLAILITLL